MKAAGIYLLIINIVTFCMYGADKSAAVRQKQRIPNKVLLFMALIGGSVGALAGMYTFRHKTQKWYYKYTVPAILLLQIAAAVFVMNGCGSKGFTEISQEEAMQMMKEQSGYLIVDVRRPDEFAEGHIPGAINVPNEVIQTAEAAAELTDDLPDQNQMLLIYCRTGRRSREASGKLAKLGYTGVYDFGGITTWTGDVVKDQ